MSEVKTKIARNVTWVAISCACLIALMGFGPRPAMGFFQLPMLQDTGWDRSTFALAMAIQNLAWGLGQPVLGAISDRYGTWRVQYLGIFAAVVPWPIRERTVSRYEVLQSQV